MDAPISLQPLELARLIGAELISKKAFNVVAVNLDGKTIIADYFLIASGSNATQVRALAEHIDETLDKKWGIRPLRKEGLKEGRWAALDYGVVIVHIFLAETREFYQLERLWTDGANVIEIK